jgi:hypothetical protein
VLLASYVQCCGAAGLAVKIVKIFTTFKSFNVPVLVLIYFLPIPQALIS